MMLKEIQRALCVYVYICVCVCVCVDSIVWPTYLRIYQGTCNLLCVCYCIFSDVAALSTPGAVCGPGESPLRSHRHSWRQQIFLRVATPQKNTDTNGKNSQNKTQKTWDRKVMDLLKMCCTFTPKSQTFVHFYSRASLRLFGTKRTRMRM